MKKSIIIAAAAIVAMTACNKALIETPVSESDYGYINLGITADTEMSVITKAGEANSDYLVTLKQGSDTKWGPKKYSEITDWKVAAGAGYTLYVENVDEAGAAPANEKGCVRVAGTSEAFEVKAGLATPVSVACVPVNSMVTVAYDNDFTNVFTDPAINITDGTRAFDMAWGHDKANGAFYSAGKTISWTLNVTLKDGTTKKKYSCPDQKKFTTVSDRWTLVTFSTSSTNGNINVYITVDGEITETITVSETIDPLEGDVVPTVTE